AGLTEFHRPPNTARHLRAPTRDKYAANGSKRMSNTPAPAGTARNDWTLQEVQSLFALPFADLMFSAQQAHRTHHAANQGQVSTPLSIKPGGCPEDCAYCPQSIRYHTGVEREALMEVEAV